MTLAVGIIGILLGLVALATHRLGGILMATTAEVAAHFDALKTRLDTANQLLREIADVLRSGTGDAAANDSLIAKIDAATAETDQVLADTKDVDPTP